MKILVYGAAIIGTLYASRLQEAGIREIPFGPPGIAGAERWPQGPSRMPTSPPERLPSEGILIELDCLRIPEQLQRT